MSSKHSSKEFSWKQGKLYKGNELVAELVKVDVGMFKIKFSNGDLSADAYDKTRAKENAIRLLVDELNTQQSSGEARGCV